MSRKFKNKYNSFHREILKEVITDKELNQLDKKYSKAKKIRAIRRIEDELEQIEEEIENKSKKREKKKKPMMRVSGKSVFQLQKVIKHKNK